VEGELLDELTVQRAAGQLARSDPDLSAVLTRHGPPSLWAREPGFQTLVRIILEQQVTLESGRAAFERLESAAGHVDPDALVRLGEMGARAAGITRQKSGYLIGLAAAVVGGTLDVDVLERLPDNDVRSALIAVPGIGPWTADVYLLLALRRPDAWPTADMALAASAQFVKRLPSRPTFPELDVMAEAWRPWRAVAARLLWHSYLSGDRPPRNGIDRPASSFR
jgi:DNA-3-methyladenine glycosylase II